MFSQKEREYIVKDQRNFCPLRKLKKDINRQWKLRNVFVLKEAVADLENGRVFYEERQPGLDDYFWDTLLSDPESLVIYG